MLDVVHLSVGSRATIIALLRCRIVDLNSSIITMSFDSPMLSHYVAFRHDLEIALSVIGYEQNHD